MPRPRFRRVEEVVAVLRESLSGEKAGAEGFDAKLKTAAHVEAAARILVARRGKQAGMHWRLANAACVCALLARLRSAA
ncbi:MAG: hypothetical protein ILO10_03230 [Kiritimatiellae bacterium]|nr:hypothetical protein [Kiritimatiellia bacterium]